MKFFSHYFWESASEENPVSLVLQQVKLRKGRCLLVCICDGSRSEAHGSIISGYFTERLVEWFHHKCIQELQNHHREQQIYQMLRDETDKIQAELLEYGTQKEIRAEYDVLGMVVFENEFCCFSKGDCLGYVFNRRFNRKQRRELREVVSLTRDSSQMQLMQGSLQKGIGILLCNASYLSNITEEETMEVLFEDHLNDQDIYKRLRELWNENKRRGEQGYAGAVFFRTE